MNAPLLSLRGVTASYGASPVLTDVSFGVLPGEAVALIGRNGVGKTTLMAAITGTKTLSGGQVTFGDVDVTHAPAHRRARHGIGTVPQGRHVFAQLTVAENLATGLAAATARNASVPDIVYDLFPKLAELRDRKAGFLSGGEQQQLAIGRALCGAPRLLLLDEPTEGIQPSIVRQIEDALTRLRAETGMAILIVEQYLDLVWRVADRFVAMENGCIRKIGRTADHDQDEVAHFVHI